MHKITRVSGYIIKLLTFFKFFLPLIILLIWMFIETDFVKDLIAKGSLYRPLQTSAGLINLSTVNWTSLSKFMGFMSEITGSLPYFISLFYLTNIFKNYTRGIIFDVSNATYYNRLGWLLLCDALLIRTLSDTLRELAVTFSNPPGERYLSISFGSPQVTILFYGMLVLVISWVMAEGSKIQDEQNYTI